MLSHVPPTELEIPIIVTFGISLKTTKKEGNLNFVKMKSSKLKLENVQNCYTIRKTYRTHVSFTILPVTYYCLYTSSWSSLGPQIA